MWHNDNNFGLEGSDSCWSHVELWKVCFENTLNTEKFFRYSVSFRRSFARLQNRRQNTRRIEIRIVQDVIVLLFRYSIIINSDLLITRWRSSQVRSLHSQRKRLRIIGRNIGGMSWRTWLSCCNVIFGFGWLCLVNVMFGLIQKKRPVHGHGLAV